MSKKSQLKTMQTIFIMIFLFIILFMVFVFAIIKDKQNSELQQEELVSFTQNEKAQIIDYLPELRCSRENTILNDCFDKLAIQSFNQITKNNKLYYNTLLGLSKIKIKEFNTNWTELTIYNNKPETIKSEKVILKPVLIRDVLEEKNNFGVMEITLYS